jgi:hypothetical protein
VSIGFSQKSGFVSGPWSSVFGNGRRRLERGAGGRHEE